jgi:broad specificity phosphatase PhoE
MTARLVLISHASTEATRRACFPGDEPLDPPGLAAAAAAAPTARALPRTGTVLTGPEQRCRRTAAALGLDAAVEPLLADLDAGSWRGRRLADLEQEDPAGLSAWLTDPAAAPHGGEGIAQLLARTVSWLEGVPDGPARVVAVTHPAVVRSAVLHALGAPPQVFWRIDVAPLTQTWLTRNTGRWRLRETGHPLSPGDS